MIACSFHIRDIWIYLIEMVLYLFLLFQFIAHPENAFVKACSENKKTLI